MKLKHSIFFISLLILFLASTNSSYAAQMNVKGGTWQQGDHQQPDFSSDLKMTGTVAPGTWDSTRAIYVPYLGSEYTDVPIEDLMNRLRNLEKTPSAQVSFSGNADNLNGNVKFTVNIDHAQHVEIKLVFPGSSEYIWLGDSKRVSGKTRTLSWDTTNTPNGTYVVEAFVSNIFGRYQLTGPTIKINNKGQGLKFRLDNPSKLPKGIQKHLPYKDNAPDGDGDGLPDEAEQKFGTDALNPDTDSDGYLDGIEVARKHDPNSASSPGQSVTLPSSAEQSGEIRDDVYRIDDISLDKTGGNEAITIKGKGRPKSFAVVYTYSELPTMVTVRTNESGNFEYTLSKALENGEHRVYVGLADSNGSLAEKSNPRFFVKEAQAIIVSASQSSETNLKHETPEEKLLAEDKKLPATTSETSQPPAVTSTPAEPSAQIATPKSPFKPLRAIVAVLAVILLAGILLTLILWQILKDQNKKAPKSIKSRN
jgi:hypothetical protein